MIDLDAARGNRVRTVGFRAPESLLAPLRGWPADRATAVFEAKRRMREYAVIADAASEGLGIAAGDVQLLGEGVTPGADLWTSLRVRDLYKSYDRCVALAESEVEASLAVFALDGVVEGRAGGDPVARAVDFLLEAVYAGCDPTISRHRSNAALIRAGYPWLWVPTDTGLAAYRRALALMRTTANPEALLAILMGSLDGARMSARPLQGAAGAAG